MNRKDVLRPIYGTIVFQPFALLWCWMTGDDYLTMIGPFILYSTIIFMPIYSIYEWIWARRESRQVYLPDGRYALMDNLD